MAATLQQWIVETGQHAVQSRRGQPHLRCGEVVRRMKVEEVKGEGPYVAKARTVDGQGVQVLLARGGDAARVGASVEVGSVVGIRAPSWEVDVDDASWIVAVDWKMMP